MRANCPAHQVLCDLIGLIIFYEQKTNHEASRYLGSPNLLHPPAASYLLIQNTVLNTEFSNTRNLSLFL